HPPQPMATQHQMRICYRVSDDS
ncbi:hypothetical protein CCACVL1_00058, partial [Corchorus capsularis]